MAFAVKTVRGAKPKANKDRHTGRRFLSAAFLAGMGVIGSLGAVAAVVSLQRGVVPHASASAGNPAIRPFAAHSVALVTYDTTRKTPKFPRVPELKQAGWQVSDLDEGSVIGQDGEVIVITPPKPKVVVAAKPPLDPDAFEARAAGLDMMQVASIYTPVRSYSSLDAPAPAEIVALEEPGPAIGTSPQEPFSLVLAETDDDTEIPLPGMRPKRLVDAAKRAPQVMAYAPQDNNIQDIAPSYRPAPVLTARARTAIYSIEQKTVYMPNGERLEAHSGLGPMLDDPRFVHKKMRGATPPHTYRLTMREALFHGVEAIRLNPLDPSKIFGRDGLLAHTYMLGKRGDSNGCLVFKDYKRFLAAFKRGEITQLVVVARLPGGSTNVASR
ncbi:DUF2778 domain-containing protein [Phyllobacterium sp. YR531]|uniref:DUF2778 domain-containing protein n=1 Tax=Phyllobacterium sp. YR531 TaxID=1144343 RepID=UPI00026F86DB|nr:DUF2778 domain-containing protein [Phyllobacterium sp. YR531]EJN05271.1 Protein of unknown function (DUF2778) [Phyllobacterium sp. YR531]